VFSSAVGGRACIFSFCNAGRPTKGVLQNPGHQSSTFVASHLISAAFTSSGFSICNQCSASTLHSVKSRQNLRIGSADTTQVRCTDSVMLCLDEQTRQIEETFVGRRLRVGRIGCMIKIVSRGAKKSCPLHGIGDSLVQLWIIGEYGAREVTIRSSIITTIKGAIAGND